MIYTDNKGRTLDVTVWDGSDVTEDVLGAPRTGADLDAGRDGEKLRLRPRRL